MIGGPHAAMLGLSMEEEAVDGGFVLVMPFAARLTGRPGYLHGGVIAGLLEAAGLEAVRRAVTDQPTAVQPVTVTVDYLRGGRPLTTRATATVTRLGKRIANVEAWAWQDDADRPIGRARMNATLRRG